MTEISTNDLTQLVIEQEETIERLAAENCRLARLLAMSLAGSDEEKWRDMNGEHNQAPGDCER